MRHSQNMKKRIIAVAMTLSMVGGMALNQPMTVLGAEVLPEETESIKEQSLETGGTVEEPEALPYGLAGMPGDYEPDQEDLAEKEKAKENKMAESLSDMTPGVDYVEDEIIYLADSREYAEEVAKAFNAVLWDYSYGVAVARITDPELSVQEAVSASLDPALDLPVVSPNHLIYLDDPMPSVEEVFATEEEEPELSNSALLAGADWSYANDILADDPAIVPGCTFTEHNAWEPNRDEDKDGYQWMHDMIGTYQAWGTTMGSNEITVAVIDTGVDDEHEDLISADPEGRFVKNIKGVYQPEPKESAESVDASGHGTHVAGIIGMTANNDLGGAGVAPKVNILGIQIYGWYEETESGSFDDANITRAINYVAGLNENGTDNGQRRADIINMSLGGPGYAAATEQAVENAYKAGVTVIASMGNDGVNAFKFPAGYDHVIAVAAVDRDGNRTDFSDYGDWCDIAAPGKDIFSTWNGHDNDKYEKPVLVTTDRHDWYASWPGTSMAAPVVAGACALYMSEVGHVDPDTMETVLKKTATKTKDKSIGAGIVNVAAMMPDYTKEKDAKWNAPVIEKKTGEGTYEALTDGDTLAYDDVIRITAGAAYLGPLCTVNGKNPAFKDGVAATGFYLDNGKDCRVSELVLNGAPTEKAFSLKAVYMSPQGTTSKVATVKNLKIEESGSSEEVALEIYGTDIIARGKSAVYTVTSDPTDKVQNGVTWTVSGNDIAGISVNKQGKVTVKNNVPADTAFEVVATLTDQPEVSKAYPVTVKEPCTGISIGYNGGKENEDLYLPKFDKNGSLTSARLYTVNVPGSKRSWAENQLNINVDLKGTECTFTASSTRPGVAEAEYDDKNETWYIQAGSTPGSTKITFTADDGSGKKATLTVNTIVPASSLYVSTKNNQAYVIPSKSVQFLGTIGNTYGKPSVSKLTWDYGVEVEYTDLNNSENTIPSRDVTEEWKDRKYATITQTGKLTVAKAAGEYAPPVPDGYSEDDYSTKVKIYGKTKTTDGTELGYSKGYVILSTPVSSIYWFLKPWNWKEGDAVDWRLGNGVVDLGEYPIDPVTGYADSFDECLYVYAEDNLLYGDQEDFYRTSSGSPKVISVDQGVSEKFGEKFCLKYPINANKIRIGKTETVKVTVKVNDGSEKKIVVTLKATGVEKTEN